MDGLSGTAGNGAERGPPSPHRVDGQTGVAPRPGLLASPQARYEATFFGRFQVTLGDQALDEQTWRRKGVRTLLKWLLLNPGERFGVGQLCGLLWPERDAIRAANSFHVTLHYLRRGLEPDLGRGAASMFVRNDRKQHYWLEFGDRWWTDVLEVGALSRAGREAERQREAGRAIECYEKVLRYYALTFLPEDIYDDIFEPYRSEHDRGHAHTLKRLMRLYLQDNQLPSAHAVALRALAIDPFAEEAVRTLVMVYLSQGDSAAAVRQLDELFQVMARDLGCAPNDELRALRQAIQSGDLRSLPPRTAMGRATPRLPILPQVTWRS